MHCAAKPGDTAPSLAGLAGCLALLELEARALGHPLAARLIAAAGEALRETLVAKQGPPTNPPGGM